MTQQWADYSSLINVNELTEKVRHAAQPTQAFAQIAGAPLGKAIGKNKGDTVQLTFYPDVDTAGGELSESEEVPTTGLTPVKTTYTISEYGNGMNWNERLELFARLELEDNFMVALMNDYNKMRNNLAYTVAKTTDYKAVFVAAADTFVTNGSASGVADEAWSLDNLRFLKTKAKLKKIPKYDGESYVVATGVQGIADIQGDPTYQTLLSRDSGRSALNGELGRLFECRLIEDNHKIAASGSNGYDEGLLFGADGISYDVAMPIEIRREPPRDLGRAMKVGYIEYSKYFKPLDMTDHGIEHVIHVTSAS